MSSGPDLATDPRMAGALTRYHAWMTVRTRTMADHAWNVTRILLAIHPQADRLTIVEALLHDVGEVRAGDPPFPVKREHPEYARTHLAVEQQAWREMVIPWSLPPHSHLAPLQVWAIKLADMIESWETGLEEMMLGNRLAGLIVQRSRMWLDHELQQYPDDVTSIAEIAGAARAYMQRRETVWSVRT